jgi:hypothetical protein
MTDEVAPTERQTKPRKSRGGRPRKARGAGTSSDASDTRWTVRGIPTNVRDIAVKAAESQGKTVGDWLAEAIVSASKSDDKRVSADGSPNLAGPELIEFMATVTERLTKLEERQPSSWFSKLFRG